MLRYQRFTAIIFKATTGGPHIFGHNDSNHALLQKQSMSGYQNYILPETSGQWSLIAHDAL